MVRLIIVKFDIDVCFENLSIQIVRMRKILAMKYFWKVCCFYCKLVILIKARKRAPNIKNYFSSHNLNINRAACKQVIQN